ncbi:DinB family protein [Spirosoma sp. SC4-14]|uniref:DinB family protein n=1 Tax=Spirosoma sp. SC4-14 TaxID=3128900 RepID=UPI0030CD622B
MPRFTTNLLLQDLYNDVDALQRIIEQEFRPLTEAQLRQAPAPDQWSIVQCLDHLSSYGFYYLPLMEKSIQTGQQQCLLPQETFTSGWLGNYFAETMQPGADGSIRLKMKAVKNHTPQQQLDTEAVLTEFLRQQERLLQLLERAQQVDISKLRIPISIARWIRLSLGDTFRFLIAHEQRHVLQAQRVRHQLFSQRAFSE